MRTRILAFGAAVFAGATALTLSHHDSITNTEAEIFAAINDAPDGLRTVLWPTMQLGNGLMAIAVPIAVAATNPRRPDWDLAARGSAAAFGAWQLAKGVKVAVRRGRPARYIDTVRFRDGVPDGLGYVSGHTTVAVAVAAVLTPRLSPSAATVAWTLAATVGVARIYVGAHLPLDVLGGIGLGAILGGVLAPAVEGSR